MSVLRRFVLSIVLCGCRPQHASPNSEQIPSSPQRSSAILPVVDVPIIVTDLASGVELPGMRIQSTGRLLSSISPGQYKFAVTTANAFAFVEQTLTKTDRPTILLSSECHRVHGQITGKLALPSIVLLVRNNTGDRFSTDIDASGRFSACLPQGAYWVQAIGAALSITTPLVLTKEVSFDLLVYSKSQVEQIPGDIRIPSVDMSSLVQAIRERQIIGLGEANHGTSEFYQYRGQLSLELARTENLRLILLEADAIGMMAIDDYVMGISFDVSKAVVALKFWITDIEEFLAFLGHVRAYNANVPQASKIHVLGIDAQRLEAPTQFLLANQQQLSISKADADMLVRIAPKHGAAFASMSSDERTVLSGLLDRLASPRNPANLEGIITRASIAARSIRLQLGYLDSIVELRDQAMAELAAYIFELSGSKQAALWAHDGHVARQHDGANTSLGQYLAEKFGERYYPIAFLSYRGSGRAWDKPGKVGVIPHTLDQTPPYNVESMIMNATGLPEVAWVRLDTSTGALAQWLSFPRYVREFGSLFDPSDLQTLRPFPASFAAVVVVQHAGPSTPTPTGVRKVTP